MSNMPNEVAEYFKNGKRTIKSVVPNDNYTLTITFDNGETRLYSMADKLKGVMSVLKDTNKFKECFLDDTGNIAWDIDKSIDSNVVWSNRIDLCTDSIYIYSVPTNNQIMNLN